MKIIDLTHLITESMPVYPGFEPPKLHIACDHDEYGFRETYIGLYSHTGTHIDAPAHLFPDGLSLDQYPVTQFVGKALVIDCRKLEKREKISMSLLEDKGSVLYEADFLLFLTGHSNLWGKPDYFSDFPVVSNEVAEWINSRKLKGIGIDAPSFDFVEAEEPEGNGDELPIHRLILQTNHTILLENLCNLAAIGYDLFTLCALPLHTQNADGAPARIIAIIEP